MKHKLTFPAPRPSPAWAFVRTATVDVVDVGVGSLPTRATAIFLTSCLESPS